MKLIHSYLALGDSYTIGESVPAEQSFPNQLAGLLRVRNEPILLPQIIAKTGWTTDELIDAIEKTEQGSPIPTDHDLVTLLIGVNNQYRGRDVNEFADQFRDLLQRAIRYAKNDPRQVRVLSIPDWGVTPFAADRNRVQIAQEIDAYNERKKQICAESDVPYIYITDLTREAAHRNELLTNDGLHPSGADYKRWTERVLESLENC